MKQQQKIIRSVALASSIIASGNVLAEDSFKLYGVLDAAVGSVAHQYNVDGNATNGINPVSPITPTASSSKTTNGIFGGGIQGSRWGIQGSEDLGNGLKTSFRLESGINIISGSVVNQAQSLADNTGKIANNITGSSQDGQLFGREAWVSLGSQNLGTITFGRQYALFYDIYKDYEPVQFAALFTPLGFSGSYQGGGGVSENLRQDGSVRYAKKWSEINFSAQYKLGNVAGNNGQNSAYGFRLGYEGNGIGVQASWQVARDVIGGAASGVTAAPINVVEQNLQAWLITGRYSVNPNLTLKAGYQRYSLEAPSDPLTASSPGATLYNGFSVNRYYNVGPTQNVSIFDVGGDYNFTDKLNLALGFYAVNYDAYGTGSGTISSTSVAGGATKSINYFSALADYHFSKRTDTYAGYLSVAPSGDYTARGFSNNSVLAAGIRHMF